MSTEKPKLIIINGPVGIGKSTIADRYIADHLFAFHVNGDEILSNIGGWLDHETEARQMVFAIVKSMVTTHLSAGHDVVVPHLLAHPEDATEFEAIAGRLGATFFECTLLSEKEEAVARALERGVWGDERNAPPMTEADTPIIEKLFDYVQLSLAKRPNMAIIQSVRGDIDGTYRQFMDALEKAAKNS